MKILFCVLALTGSLVTITVANAASASGGCDPLLTYSRKTISADPAWISLGDRLGLNPAETENAHKTFDFFLTAYHARIRHESLGDLKTPFVTEQAGGLLHAQRQLLQMWPRIVEAPMSKLNKNKRSEVMARLDKAHQSLVALSTALAKLMSMPGDHVPYSALFQLQWLTAAHVDELGTLFGFRKDIRAPGFDAWYGFSLLVEIDKIMKFAGELVDDPNAVIDSEVIQEDLAHINAAFAENGTLHIPVVGSVSDREKMATAFLPVEFLRYQPDLPPVSLTNQWLQDNGGGYRSHKFKLDELKDSAPEAWIEALNKTYSQWHELVSVSDSQMLRVLSHIRFADDERSITVDWSKPEKLIDYLWTQFLFDSREDASVRLSDDDVREIVTDDFTEDDLVRATNDLLKKLLQTPDLKFDDQNALEVFRKYPDSALAVKFAILKSMTGRP